MGGTGIHPGEDFLLHNQTKPAWSHVGKSTLLLIPAI
jgi:hypothetical protein